MRAGYIREEIKMITNEKEMQDLLYSELKKFEGKILKKGFKSGTEVPVPYQHIYTQSGEKIKLEIWCFNQDIAIYTPLDFSDLQKQPTGHIEIEVTNTTKSRSTIEKGIIGFPYVILELKHKQPTTDSILAYTQKAALIKSIFPHCQYWLVVYETVNPRTFRLGYGIFDNIVSLNDKKDFNLQDGIMGALAKAEEKLKEIQLGSK
jgi:hypothetical protein